MKTLSRTEALALADKLEGELKSDDPGLRKTVMLRFLDDSVMRIESAFIHKEGKWLLIISEHHRAMVYDDEEVDYTVTDWPTEEQKAIEIARAEEILSACKTGNVAPTDTRVPINFHDDMYWVIHAEKILRPGEEQPVIRMFWGWTAGMDRADLSSLAEDSPRGEDYVYTSLEMALDLRDKLNELLEE